VNIEELQNICKKFPGVTEDIKWEDHLCFNVGGKMFLITSPDTVPVTASFKVSEDDFEVLSMKDGFKPSPYLARHKWVYLDDIRRLSKREWEKYMKQAYTIIGNKLPLKTKKKIKFAE
jgi:predicted DNA-binding protein (MmcQ/YjbR family)